MIQGPHILEHKCTRKMCRGSNESGDRAAVVGGPAQSGGVPAAAQLFYVLLW